MKKRISSLYLTVLLMFSFFIFNPGASHAYTVAGNPTEATSNPILVFDLNFGTGLSIASGIRATITITSGSNSQSFTYTRSGTGTANTIQADTTNVLTTAYLATLAGYTGATDLLGITTSSMKIGGNLIVVSAGDVVKLDVQTPDTGSVTASGSASVTIPSPVVSGLYPTAAMGATAVSIQAKTMTKAANTDQTVAVSTAAPTALSVTLSPVPAVGTSVVFTASGGTFANGTNTVTATTDASGVATATTYTLGSTTAANYTVTATSTGYPDAVFTMTPQPGAAASVTLTSGDTQTGTVHTPLAQPFTVTVKDANGNAVAAGTTVNFAVTSGAGTLSAATATTSATGTASVTLTLGDTAGANSVTATVGTSTVTFTATGTAGAATQLILAASQTTVSSTVASVVTLTGTLKDAYNNIVTTDSTTSVTFTLTGASGLAAFTNAAAGTAASGVATVTVTTVAQQSTTQSYSFTVDASTTAIAATSVTDVTINLAPFSLTPATVNLVVGDTKGFSVTGGTATTAWTKTGAVTVGTLSASTGTSATYTSVGVGADTINLSDTISSANVTASATVNNYAAVATSVTSAVGLVMGQTMPVIITGGNGSFTCTSSNTAVATVTANAVNNTCTVTPVAVGSITVTVADTAVYGGVTKTTNSSTTAAIEVIAPITVTSAAADGKVYLSLDGTKSHTIVATGGKVSGTYKYTSATPAVATVTATGGVVTAVATGSTVITITDAAYSNVTQTVTVVVMGPMTIKDTTAAGNAITTAQMALSGTPGLDFKVHGGSTNFTVTAAGPGITGSSTLVASAAGVYTFKAPITGAFAGVYTITITDTTSALTKTLTVNVPYKVTASKMNILGGDKTQTLMVTGGASGDIFKLSVLDKNGAADTTGKVVGLTTTNDGANAAATLNVTATNASATGNPAVAYMAPVTTLTSATLFKVKAVLQTNGADATATWATAPSNIISILPMTTFTVTVKDTSGAAVAGATVSLRNKSEAKSFGLTDVQIALAVTDANGMTTVSLPNGVQYTFDVMPASATSHQPGTVKIVSGTTTGTVTLQKIDAASLSSYTGSISVSGRCVGFTAADKAAADAALLNKMGCTTANGTWGTIIASPQIAAIDATGKEVKMDVATVGACTAVGATLSACVSAGGTWTQPFTLNLDASKFTPVKFAALAIGAKPANKPTATEVLPTSVCSDATKLTYSSCLAVAGNTWSATFATPFTLLEQPPQDATTLANVKSTTVTAMNGVTVASSMVVGAMDPTYKESTKTFTLPALNTFIPAAGAGTTAVSTAKAINRPRGTNKGAPGVSNALNVVGYDPAIVVLYDAAGNIMSAPVVSQPFSTTQEAKISGGSAQMGAGGTQPLVLGATEKQSFDLSKQSDGATASNLSTITSVGVLIPTQAFADPTVTVFSTVRAAKLDDATVAGSSAFTNGNLTGGEIVEIDLVALDSNGDALSTGTGNTNITSSIPVTIPLSRNAVVSAANLVIYTAPTMQDFLDGTNITTLTDVTYDATTFEVTFNTKHFSVFVPGISSGSSSSSTGGGGCFIATAAYGSYEAPYVQLLREFRDQYLLTNAAGSWFVDQYYTYSPPMADWLRGHDGLRGVVRVLLLPLIGMSWFLIHASLSMQIALLTGLLLIPVGIAGFRRRRFAQQS